MSRPTRRAASRLAALAAAWATLLLLPTRAAAQAEPEAPEIAEAPRQYRIGLTGSAMRWEDASERAPGDGSLWGVDVERVLFRYLGVRLDAALGTNVVRGASDSADVTTYLAELVVAARIAPPELEKEIGVVPFLAAGIGTLVHDPEPEELTTASQNALSWGLGVELTRFDGFGARAEWRRYDVDLEDLFDPLDRTGRSRRADRLQLTGYVTF